MEARQHFARMTPQDTRATCQSLLEALLAEQASVAFACLGTVDGRAYAYAGADAATAASRFSAITCSLLALSESFSKEALRSNCNHSAVSTDHGNIVIVRVPSASRAYALSVCADGSDLLATTLRRTLDTAARLAEILDRAA